MTGRKENDNLWLLKQYRELINEIEKAFAEVINPEKTAGDEIDFPFDVFIDTSSNELVVEIEIPGLNIEDVSLNAADQLLQVSGKKDTLRSNRYESCVCLERENGAFNKIIHLGRAVNLSAVSAHLEDGVLTVRFPLVEEKRGIKKIEIRQ